MRRSLWICVLLLLTSIGQTTTAQSGDLPRLFVLVDSTLYTLNEDTWMLEPYPVELPIGYPRISPDGTRFIYTYLPPGGESISAPWEGYENWHPSDIFIGDMSDGTAFQIAGQPDNFSQDSYILRSLPSWSPDGAYIWWTENRNIPDAWTEGTVLYTVASGESRLLENVYNIYGDGGIVGFAPMMIAGDSIVIHGHGLAGGQYLSAYAPDGTRLFSGTFVPELLVDRYNSFGNVVDVRAGDRHYIGIHYPYYRQWDVFDPHTNTLEPVTDGVVEIYSPLAPDTSLSLIQGTTPDDDTRLIITPDGERYTLTLPASTYFRLTPSGRSIVYVADDGLYGWRDGQSTVIPGTQEGIVQIVWGALAWRVRHDPILAETIAENRPDNRGDNSVCTLTPNLLNGAQARTIGSYRTFRYGQPIRVQLEDVPADTVFTVRDSFCITNFYTGAVAVFWQGDYDGQTVWVLVDDARGGIGIHLIQCPDSLPTRLRANSAVQVIPDMPPNNLRAEPSTSSEITTQIPAGEPLHTIQPACNEGLTWWQVDYNGTIGWTAEGQGDTYWLEPMS